MTNFELYNYIDWKKSNTIVSFFQFTSSLTNYSLCSAQIKSGYQHLFTVHLSSPVDKLLEMFYQGVHRVVVMADDHSTALNVVSQSDMLALLAQSMPLLTE